MAYGFNKEVDNWLETGDEVAKAKIMEQLNRWLKNHTELLPVFGLPGKFIEDQPIPFLSADLTLLKEVQTHSENLLQLSKIALQKLNATSIDYYSETDSLNTKSKEPQGGTVMPIVDGLENF